MPAGLQIEPQTLAALQQQGHLTSSLNSQRLTAELLALLGYGAAVPSLQLLQQTQLLQHVLPMHAAYMQLHQQLAAPQQQQQGCSQQPVSSSCLPAQHWGDTGPASAADCQHDSSSKGRASVAAVPAGQQQLKQAAALQPQAASALGQLWLGQFPSSNPQTLNAHPQQAGQQSMQQQQQVQELQRQHQQLQHTNLLLQVLAALDQHASVSQPAPAEVVLACLTAPLLVDALAAAVTLLQEHVHNNKHSRQQLPALQHVQQQPLHRKQQEQDLATEALHLRQDQIAAAQAYSQPAAEMLTLVLQPLPAARSVARHFSSSSAGLDAGELCMAQHSDLAWRPGQEAVQQLLQGMSAAGFIQQQGVHIASQVSRG
jgi:tRNA nucleotidyltransferase/poly(A) polymerase